MSMNYQIQKNRLAERFITANLVENKETVIDLYDLMARYDRYAGQHTIPDDVFVDLVLNRFPGSQIDYLKNHIKGLVFKDQIKIYQEPPKEQDDPKTLKMDIRLDTMLACQPMYVENGFSAEIFSRYMKFSILGGVQITEFGDIPLEDAIRYLDYCVTKKATLIKDGNRYVVLKPN